MYINLGHPYYKVCLIWDQMTVFEVYFPDIYLKETAANSSDS